MASFVDSLTTQHIQAESDVERRRAAFRYANASLALEGFETDSAQLTQQEEVIQGRLTTEQAIAQCVAEFSENKSHQDAKNLPL